MFSEAWTAEEKMKHNDLISGKEAQLVSLKRVGRCHRQARISSTKVRRFTVERREGDKCAANVGLTKKGKRDERELQVESTFYIMRICIALSLFKLSHLRQSRPADKGKSKVTIAWRGESLERTLREKPGASTRVSTIHTKNVVEALIHKVLASACHDRTKVAHVR